MENKRAIMEWKNPIHFYYLTLLAAMILLATGITSAAPKSSMNNPTLTLEDYDPTGVKEILEEIERQGGLAGPIEPRSGNYYFSVPYHQLSRKSQRSSNLRLRFGKRGINAPTIGQMNGAYGQPLSFSSWKEGEDGK